MLKWCFRFVVHDHGQDHVHLSLDGDSLLDSLLWDTVLLVSLFIVPLLTSLFSSEDTFSSELIGTETDNIFRGYKFALTALSPIK